MTDPVDDGQTRPAPSSGGFFGWPTRSHTRVAAVFLSVWLTAIAVARVVGWYPQQLADYVAVGVLGAIALLLCRRMPLPGLIIVGVASVSPLWLFDQPEIRILPLIIAGFAATSSGLRMAIAAPIALALSVLTLAPLLALFIGNRPGFRIGAIGNYLTYNDPSSRALALLVVAAALLLGGSLRRQREAVFALAERNAELLRLRDADIARAASEERAAVARDIHDVVAHHVAAMVIRAQAAERVADSRPQELRSAVSWIASSGKEALASMRQVVRVLSAPADDDVSLSTAVERLASRVIDTGVEVTTEVRVDDPLTAGQERAIVRITQEALTNVMLHSDARVVKVRISGSGGAATLSVEDDGRAVEVLDEASGGNGVRGMRDRVKQLGGTMSIGPIDPRGWRVDVTLPALSRVLV